MAADRGLRGDLRAVGRDRVCDRLGAALDRLRAAPRRRDPARPKEPARLELRLRPHVRAGDVGRDHHQQRAGCRARVRGRHDAGRLHGLGDLDQRPHARRARRPLRIEGVRPRLLGHGRAARRHRTTRRSRSRAVRACSSQAPSSCRAGCAASTRSNATRGAPRRYCSASPHCSSLPVRSRASFRRCTLRRRYAWR